MLLLDGSLPTPLLNDLIEVLTGNRLSPYNAILSTQLPDGSWLHATDASISMEMAVTIGRRPAIQYQAPALVAQGMLSQACLEFLGALARARVSIVLAGERGSGKTTLANALVNQLPAEDRVVVVEEAFPELQTTRPNVVRLLSPAEGSSPLLPALSKPITLANLIAHALRLAPDHMVVGACRDGAVLAMLEAMNTGQTGWLLTLNAHSTRHALFRLASLALHTMGGPLPEAVHALIASSMQVVAYLAHAPYGRSVRQVDVVLPNQEPPGGHFHLLPLFQTVQEHGQPTLQRTEARLPQEIVNCLLNAHIDPTPYLRG